MKSILKYLPLYHRPAFGRNFRKEARKLVPLYKLSLKKRATQDEGKVKEYSSPVCYAHLKGLREGFEDLS